MGTWRRPFQGACHPRRAADFIDFNRLGICEGSYPGRSARVLHIVSALAHALGNAGEAQSLPFEVARLRTMQSGGGTGEAAASALEAE